MNARGSRGFVVFFRRALGAAMLDPRVYEDVEADPVATSQALAVILLASLAAGVGATGWRDAGGGLLALSAAAGTIGLLAWTSWALVTFEIGARLLPEPQTRVDVGELLRTLGFAAAPGFVLVVGAVPGLTTPVFAATSVWLLATMVIAVKQALDYTRITRAVAVCVVGWLLAIGLVFVLGLVFGPTVVSG